MENQHIMQKLIGSQLLGGTLCCLTKSSKYDKNHS